MAYTTYGAAKAELKLANDNDQALIEGYIALAQRLIEAPRPLGTGRVFEVSSDTTRLLDAPTGCGNGDSSDPRFLLLLLPAGDLCAITTIVNGDGTVLTTADYVTEPRYSTPYYAIRLRRGLIWAAGDDPIGAISITGKWAYATSAPTDIQRAALRLVVWMYKARDNSGFDVDIKTEEGLILGARMPRDIRQILETYWSIV